MKTSRMNDGRNILFKIRRGITMSTVAIITARGGSKRIPRKNVKDFLGKPILVYSIEAAINSGVFDEVMVSTEDEEIAEIAKKAGAKVPFMRSAETSGDFCSTYDVLKEVLDDYQKQGKKFDMACCIYPTAPFVTGERLKEAMDLLQQKGADTVYPVVRFSFPPQRAVIKDENGYMQFRWPEYALTRSQDLQPFYHDAGQFYGFLVSSFYEQGKLIMDKTVPIELDEMEVQDIDNAEDWRIAEVKYAVCHGIDLYKKS